MATSLKHDQEAVRSIQFDRHELINALTHGVGLVLSLVAALALLVAALQRGEPWRIAGCGTFALSLLAVYSASTLSHVVTDSCRRTWLRALDQGCIYVLIVGSFTPFSLAYLRTGEWLTFLGVMWLLALSGFVAKVFFRHRVDAVTIWSYLLLGWMPAFPAIFSAGSVPGEVLWGWILPGGLCYTFGTVFLVVDHKPLYFHGIWHLWVIAGSACHFFGVLFHVACLPPLS